MGLYLMIHIQVQGAAESGPQYGSGAVSHGAYDLQQSHVRSDALEHYHFFCFFLFLFLGKLMFCKTYFSSWH